MNTAKSVHILAHEDIIAKNRALSDYDLVVGGATYTGSVLRITSSQLEAIREEFIQRDQMMATRAIFLGELIRGGANYQSGTLIPTEGQIEQLHAEADEPIEEASLVPDVSFWPSADDTVPLGDILSAGENELSLTANIHTILQQYLVFLESVAPRESKGFLGEKKRTQEWASRRRIDCLPDVAVRNTLTHKWIGKRYLPTESTTTLGMAEEDFKRLYYESDRKRVDVQANFQEGVLQDLALTLPRDTNALKQAVYAEGLREVLPPGHELEVTKVKIGVGQVKTIDMHVSYHDLSYVYDSVENKFVVSGLTYDQYPKVLSVAQYEGLARAIAGFLPTTSY